MVLHLLPLLLLLQLIGTGLSDASTGLTVVQQGAEVAHQVQTMRDQRNAQRWLANTLRQSQPPVRKAKVRSKK